MSRETVVRIGVLLWLALVYTALWGDLSVANTLAGLAIGAVIMLAMPLPRVPVSGRLHPLSLLELIVVASYYALESSLQIAWFAVGKPVRRCRVCCGCGCPSARTWSSCCAPTCST